MLRWFLKILYLETSEGTVEVLSTVGHSASDCAVIMKAVGTSLTWWLIHACLGWLSRAQQGNGNAEKVPWLDVLT